MKTAKILVSAIAGAALFSLPGISFPFPEKLDSAHVGPAGADNPFFSEVVFNPVVDPAWFKCDDNLYAGPSGRIYYYDNTLGVIRLLTDRGKTIVDYTASGDISEARHYSVDGDLIRKETFVRDSYGKLIRIDDYMSYAYNSGGKLSGYLHVCRNPDGSISKIDEYKEMAYFNDEALSGYTLFYRDALGNLSSSQKYSDYTYYSNGVVESYIRVDKDKYGQETAEYNFNYNPSGLTSAYTYKKFTNGQLNAIYDYSGYTYNADGLATSYTQLNKDVSGNLLSRYEYSNRSYDIKNMLASDTEKRYDQNDNFISWYDYSNRTYDVLGTLVSYDWASKDSDGNIISSGHWPSS